MKRIILLVLIFIAFYGNAVCEEIIYRVMFNSTLEPEAHMESNINIDEGEIVYFQGKLSSRQILPFPQHNFQIYVRNEQGYTGWIEEKNILLQNNIALPNTITEKHWINSFYQQFISGAEKETLFNYESFWKNDFRNFARSYDIGMAMSSWFEWVFPTCFTISNNIIEISGLYTGGYISFIIINKKYESNFIEANVLCIRKNDPHPNQHQLSKRFNEGEVYKLIFMLDGDYLDIFVNSDREKLTTLIGVDDYFKNAVKDIFLDNMINLSRIIWPRRADGSMDYPAPAGVDLSRTYEKIILTNTSNFTPTHRATDNLRLRDTANTSAKIVTTLLKDTEVQVIETGTSTTINDITANWVKVISSTGFTGWCFSGYLEEIEVNNFAASVVEGEMSVQKNNKKNSLPFPLLLAIIGGAAVAIGVVVVLKKKK